MPSLTPETWARVRYEYERTTRPIAEICAAHGISAGTLRDRMRRWNWTRRRAPVPAMGPAALTIPLLNAPLLNAPLPAAPRPVCQPGEQAGEGDKTEPPAASDPAMPAPGSYNPGLHNPGLNNTGLHNPGPSNAAARLMPAIEAAIARLAAAAAPRELEQTARALGLLTRSLRELNALAGQHPAASPANSDEDDPVPEDMDEFRRELARRIDAFVAERTTSEADGDAGDGA